MSRIRVEVCGEACDALMGVGRLDDDNYPAVTMGQAAELLEVQPAFLRSLDAAGVLTPQRSGGGHRLYSRRQLALAARMRSLFDEGLTLDAAARIVGLQDQLDTARMRIAELEDQLGASTPDRQPRAGRSMTAAGVNTQLCELGGTSSGDQRSHGEGGAGGHPKDWG